MTTATATDLLVRIDATTEALRRELRRADRTVETSTRTINQQLVRIERGFQRTGRAAQVLTASIAAVGTTFAVGRLTQAGRGALAFADDIQTAADKIGVSAEELQIFQTAAAQFADLAPQQAEVALQRFTRRVGEAVNDTGELNETLKQYKVAVVDAEGGTRPILDVLRDYAEVIKNAGSGQEQLRLAFKAFDSEGAAFVNVMRLGREGLEDWERTARELSQIMANDMVRAAAKASDELQLIQRSASTAFNVGVAEGWNDTLNDAEGTARDLAAASRNLGEVVGAAMAFATQNADALLQRLEEISRAVLAVTFAFRGFEIGIRRGPLSALVGSGIGATGGFFAVELDR